MDRDTLLLLLVVGVVLNFGLLAIVALMRAAPWRAPDERRPGAAPVEPVIPLGWAPSTPPPRGTRTRAGASAMTAASVLAPDPIPALPTVRSSPRPARPTRDVGEPTPPRPAAHDVVSTSVPAAPAVAEGTDAPAGAASPTVAAAASQAPTASTPLPSKAAPKSGTGARRPRRFTMPDLEEDHDRAARSIAAFLGEPLAPSAGAKPPRRRHRARRPAGGGARTDVILALRGDGPTTRASHALATALRDTVRESDEVVELPGGRLRVTLDADRTGSEAFVARARAVVRPWLELLGANLELRVEDPASRPSAASAAS